MFLFIAVMEFVIEHELLESTTPEMKVFLRDRLVSQWIEYQINSFEDWGSNSPKDFLILGGPSGPPRPPLLSGKLPENDPQQ